jgi:hypothetical protein
VRLYEPALAEACDRFARRVWPGSDDNTAGENGTDAIPPRVLFLKGAEVIGHVATLPVRLAVAGQVLNASWAVGLMVLPEHRNGPVAPLMMRKLNQTVEIGLTLHVEEAALRVFKGVGWRHLGVVPQYVRVLNARAFVATFGGHAEQFLSGRSARWWGTLARFSAPAAALVSLGFAALALLGAVRRRSLSGATVAEEHRFDASYTRLAEHVKDKLGVWVFRDAPYLTTRYGRRMGTYRLLACRRGARLLGYCIVKLRQFANDPRMGDVCMGTVVDCVFDPGRPEVLDLLLSAAVALCRREGADVVFCTASLREIGRGLRRHAFVPTPGTLNAAFHDCTGAIGGNVGLESWHLMRGDSDADANC